MIKNHNRKDKSRGIRREPQLRALKSPARQEIVDALNSAGACTVAELAALVARPADSLYPHIRQLLHVGLLVEGEPRRNGRHVAAVYDLPQRPLGIDYRQLGRSETLFKVVSGAVRLGLRDYDNALRDGAVDLVANPRQARGGRAKGWLNQKELKELNSLLERAERILQAGSPGNGRKAYSFSYVMAPADRRRMSEDDAE